MKKLFFGLFMVLALVSLIQIDVLQVRAQAPGIIVKISSDTAWLMSNGPHVLTGPLLVEHGVTLTVEAGSFVDLNYYEMRIHGTLLVKGTPNNPVSICNGTINYSEDSSGWNPNTNQGCIIENAVYTGVKVNSAVPLSITNSKIDREVSIVGESLIRNNELSRISLTNSSIPITKNELGGAYFHDCSLDIFENTIYVLEVKGDSFEIFDNTIKTRIQGRAKSVQIYDNSIKAIGYYKESLGEDTLTPFRASSGTIARNKIEGEVCLSGSSLTVANNDITGYTDFYEYPFFWSYEKRYYQTPGIILQGSGNVSGNRIVDCSIGVDGGPIIQGNFILTTRDGISVDTKNPIVIRNNTINSSGEASTGIRVGSRSETAVIENNFVGNGFRTGVYASSQAVIRGNTISNNELGIGFHGKESTIIEQNILENNQIGLRISSSFISVTNNTISDSGTALLIKNVTDVAINYNNIQNSIQHSIYLEETAANIDATNNWWGTTDAEEIGIKIYDSKYSFDLGEVTINPILINSNPNAKPTENPENNFSSIPEFSSIILVLVLLATLVIVVDRKNILRRT